MGSCCFSVHLTATPKTKGKHHYLSKEVKKQPKDGEVHCIHHRQSHGHPSTACRQDHWYGCQPGSQGSCESPIHAAFTVVQGSKLADIRMLAATDCPQQLLSPSNLIQPCCNEPTYSPPDKTKARTAIPNNKHTRMAIAYMVPTPVMPPFLRYITKSPKAAPLPTPSSQAHTNALPATCAAYCSQNRAFTT
jgi:hypothetical protein